MRHGRLDPFDPEVVYRPRPGEEMLDDPAVLAMLRHPRHLAAVRAFNARPGPRDDDGQPVVDPDSANVRVVCSHPYRWGACGRVLAGVWRTRYGTVLVYSVVRPDARDHIQRYKRRRRGPKPPRPGERYPDRLMAYEVPVLMDDAVDVWVSCLRHGTWKLDLAGVRQALKRERVMWRRETIGSSP